MELKDPKLFRQQSYINGQWVDADGGETATVSNPSDGKVLGTIPNCGPTETRRAIEAANAAWPAWRAKTAKERSDILRRWYDLMLAHADDLAKIMTLEQGKPFLEAKGEIAYGASFIECHPTSYGRQANCCSQGANRRLLRNYALEFSQCHDYEKSGTCFGCRLPDGR